MANELTPVAPLPKTPIEVAEMTDAEIKPRAHLLVSLSDVTRCIPDLTDFIIQGVNDSNAGKRGGVSAGLRRAAYRVEHGKLDGFSEQEKRRLMPWPDVKSLHNFIKKQRDALGDAIRQPNPDFARNAMGVIFTEMQKLLDKVEKDEAAKTKTMGG